MKTTQMITRLLLVLFCAATFVHAISDAWNPATGIFIQRIGTIYDSDPAAATVYYTRYGGVPDRVKSIDYYYDGQGYLDLKNKDTICTTGGADGIIHHPDGDLLVAGQGANTYKVSKSGGSNCVVDTATCANCSAESYHLMMDPSGNYLWGLGIPGPLVRYPTSNATPGRFGNGTRMVVDNNVNRLLTTLAWDEKGTTYYTRSGWQGTGGEFGVIDMNTYKTTKWFDVDSGAHGMTFDEYSKTIFIFGSSHIIQIDPTSKKILVDLDMYKLGFAKSYMVSKGGWVNDVQEWRFDQGTTDGKGHLFVASNSGHLVFIDYTSNINKRIDNNILIHAQFLDHWLDDVAPLSGAGSPRNYTSTTTGTSSSSSRVYSSGSYAVVTSSSSGTSSGTSSSSSSGSTSGSNSSGSLASSSSGGGTSVVGGSSSSSSGTGGTSVVGGSSSSSSGTGGTSVVGGSSSSSSGTGGTSVVGGSSSSSSGTGGTSVIGGSSSSSGTGGTSVIGGSSSSSGTGGTSVIGGSSSSSGTGGTSVIGGSSSSSGSGGTEVAPWCLVTPKPVGCDSDNSYGDVDYEIGSGQIYDQYPSDETLKKGDSSITQAVLLEPLSDSDPVTGDEIVIGGNRYLPTSTGDAVKGYTPSSTGSRDSIPVGMVVDVVLDMDKIAEYLGLEDGEAVTIHGTPGLLFVDPLDPSAPAKSVTLTGNHFWMTANEPVSSGLIYIVGPDGKSVIYDGVNFYDPIPNAKVALLIGTPKAPTYDVIEVLLADSIPAGYTVSLAQVVVNGVTYTVAVDTLIDDRVVLDASTIKNPASLLSSDKVVLTFTKSGVNFVREAPLLLASGHVIERALVLHNPHGADSLFVEFNFTVTAPDLANIDMMLLVNQSKASEGKILADRMRLPAKTLVLFDGVTQSCATSTCKQIVWKDSLGTGSLKDSIRLSELAVFANMPYITTDEYARKVPIEVVSRLPETKFAEYFDNNGDGVLDSVVVTLAEPVDSNDVKTLYFAFPWYSSANRLIQLQPQPKDLMLDASNRARIGWSVQSNVTLRRGLTSIPANLPLAELYANYAVLGNTFQDERHFPIKDKMAPAIYEARLRYGEVADSLQVTFSEAVDVDNVSGLELFDYLHGTDTLHLEPLAIRWSADGLNAWVVLPDGENRIIPGDSLILVTGVPGKVVVDVLGNMPGRNPSPVEIQGSLTHLVSTVDMGSFDPRNDSLRVASSISLTQVPGSMRTSDLRAKGELGHIVELGQRFVPQLVKNATTGEYATVPTDIDIEKVFISLQVQYFDHLGQYVTDTTVVLPCKHAKFGYNCLDTDQKLFVNWNYKNKDGRFVGSGVYMVQFKMLVQYEATTIKEEMLDKWGVRRKNK